ncbi:hypothetical protein PQ469_25020 [Mucilaginibacter sp. KACC 22773]|uniref:hypothetical protein n=1 Tax=Mucilaginibacter sp. KACC 22773 TaxID=3025671 RepID=UPI002365F36C|nr:hypothetical protein [Mucilaginibacter sp. KACC 22773]WDF77152.1 hypothetical protein PQ469_25020 [Mucilaginibacter sp. KACC 22773]
MGKNLEQWLIAKKKFGLSDAQVQMARELNLNPKKFGSLNNHDQEPWKAPLPQFIQSIYIKRFKREAPLEVTSIEDKIKNEKLKAAKKKKDKAGRRAAATSDKPTII